MWSELLASSLPSNLCDPEVAIKCHQVQAEFEMTEEDLVGKAVKQPVFWHNLIFQEKPEI